MKKPKYKNLKFKTMEKFDEWLKKTATKKINGLSKSAYAKRWERERIKRLEKKYGQQYKCHMPTRRWSIFYGG